MTTLIKFLKRVSEQDEIDKKELDDEVVAYFDFKTRAKFIFRQFITKQLETINASDLKTVLKLLDTIYKKLFIVMGTLDTYFSKDIRKPIAVRFGTKSPEHNMALNFARLSKADKDGLIRDRHNSLRERHAEVTRFDQKEAFEIISREIDNLDDPFRLAVALALASGCRPFELFNKRVNFEPVPNLPNWVTQDFLAKKRGEIVAAQKPIVGMSAAKFIERIGDMRHQVGAEHRRLISNDKNGQEVLLKTVEGKANEVTKELFGHQNNITLYSCRKMYAQLSYSLYAKNSIYGQDPSLEQWISKVLGHNPADITTSISYNHFKATEKEASSVQVEELAAKVEVLQSKVAELETGKKEQPKFSVGTKMDVNFEKIKKVYEDNNMPKQTALEELLKDQVPRSAVRLWYQKFVKGKV